MSVCAPITMETKVAEGRQISTSLAEGHAVSEAAKNCVAGAAPGLHAPGSPADAKDKDVHGGERPGNTTDDQNIKSAQVCQRVTHDRVK